MMQLNAPQDGQQSIQLPVQRCICAWHGEFFRPHWPTGYPLFVGRALTALTDNACPKFTAEQDGTAARMEAMLDKRPMCCTLAAEAPDALIQIYRDVIESNPGKWRRGICKRCKKMDFGVVIAIPPLKPKIYLPHLCVTCLAAVDPKGGVRC